MPLYTWKGVNSYNEKRKGTHEANSEAAVRAYLKKIRITPSSVKEKPKDILENISFFQPKVTGKDVVIFTRQLSTMIDAGLPLVFAGPVFIRGLTHLVRLEGSRVRGTDDVTAVLRCPGTRRHRQRNERQGLNRP